MSKNNKVSYPRKVFATSLAVLSALFIAIVSILYILYKSVSVKSDWKDYDECGI